MISEEKKKSSIPPRVGGDSFGQRKKKIPRCLLWCHIYLWNQTLQLYHISPGGFPDTLLEGCESTLWDEMNQTPMFRGERLLPTCSLALHGKNWNSIRIFLSLSNRRQENKLTNQMYLPSLFYFRIACWRLIKKKKKASEMLHTFYRILFSSRMTGRRLCCLSPGVLRTCCGLLQAGGDWYSYL